MSIIDGKAKISNKTIQIILEQHKTCLDSDNKEGTRVDSLDRALSLEYIRYEHKTNSTGVNLAKITTIYTPEEMKLLIRVK